MKPKEIPVCGEAAVRAVFDKNPDAVRRLFFDYATSRRAARLSSRMAGARRVYRVVEPGELAKIAGTMHHGGIVAIVEQRPLREATAADALAWAGAAAGRAKAGAALLVLDGVGNAHNLGAIARTAAFFGVPRMVIADDARQAFPGGAAHRVAEGGLEHVELSVARGLPEFLRGIAPGYEVIGTAVAGARPLAEVSRAAAASRRPVALVLGNEERGLAPGVAAACSRLVTIPGSGRVESLNVSAAAAVLMWELLAGG
jgi:TrmH RNA methyltransferase